MPNGKNENLGRGGGGAEGRGGRGGKETRGEEWNGRGRNVPPRSQDAVSSENTQSRRSVLAGKEDREIEDGGGGRGRTVSRVRADGQKAATESRSRSSSGAGGSRAENTGAAIAGGKKISTDLSRKDIRNRERNPSILIPGMKSYKDTVRDKQEGNAAKYISERSDYQNINDIAGKVIESIGGRELDDRMEREKQKRNERLTKKLDQIENINFVIKPNSEAQKWENRIGEKAQGKEIEGVYDFGGRESKTLERGNGPKSTRVVLPAPQGSAGAGGGREEKAAEGRRVSDYVWSNSLSTARRAGGGRRSEEAKRESLGRRVTRDSDDDVYDFGGRQGGSRLEAASVGNREEEKAANGGRRSVERRPEANREREKSNGSTSAPRKANAQTRGKNGEQGKR